MALAPSYEGVYINDLLIIDKFRSNNRTNFKIKCKCGNIFNARADNIITGHTKSCGKCSKNVFYEHPDGYMVGVTTKGQEFYFDKEDFNRVLKFTWFKAGNYICSKKAGFLHHFILNTNQLVDHIDRNPLNNRRGNLRISDRSLNMMNTIKRKSICKYKGVSIDKRTGKYYAQIGYDFKIYHLGTFNTEEEAALAYNKKALELYGKHVKLNKIGVMNYGIKPTPCEVV